METSQPSLPPSPEAPRVSGLALRGFALPRGIPGRLGGFIMARGGQAAAGEITGLLDIRAGDQILEVGYGPGVLLRQLAGHTRVGRVTGVDPSPVMRDMARRRCKAAIAAGRADPLLGTAARTGLPGAAFDHVVSVNNVLFWDSIPAGLAELRRVLRPAGSVAIAFHSRTSPSRHERRIGLSEHDAARIHAAMRDTFGTTARHDLRHLTVFTAGSANESRGRRGEPAGSASPARVTPYPEAV